MSSNVGLRRVLGYRSPNYVYKAYDCDLRLLPRNYKISDDIGFKFSDRPLEIISDLLTLIFC
ncbi:MAG: hypothetical protein DRJ51_04515 [Thermoprotei archaeon]|nr:MAG: hypothetical protein DRJ51_04515 [Thermoprotei archaeon]RLE89170.1 MAG: hypothetical protein DRJ49_03870 [Thermoprotei archaeon]